MRKLFVIVARAVFNCVYRCCCLFPRRNEVLFLSRQSDTPSDDFVALGNMFFSRGYHPVYLTKRLSLRSVVPYFFHAINEIYHLARCRICVLDRYDPMVSLINFDCESESAENEGDPLHREYPRDPIIIQIWHAFGAFKRFGYQSIGTREGHKIEIANLFDIHRNYSWIICTGENNRKAFAEAFSYPEERVVSLGRPKYAELLAIKEKVAQESERCQPVFLFAPTLRKSSESQHPFRSLYKCGINLPGGKVIWSFHPLEQGVGASGSVSQTLLQADYVVTDYSSIVYEAYLLGKRVLFYVPDLLEYRAAPGLNADPEDLCPRLCFDQKKPWSARYANYVWAKSATLKKN